MSDEGIIVIPTFPPSPPTADTRTMSTSPEWFTTPVKAPYRPSPLSLSIPLTTLEDLVQLQQPGSPDGSLPSDAGTPPLSPSSTISSIEMNRKASSSSSSGSEADSEDILVTPYSRNPALGRRNSPSYFDLEPPSRQSKKSYRPRFPGLPVSGLIEPKWRLEEEKKSKVNEATIGLLLEPFQISTKEAEPAYVLSEDSFVITHVPAKSVSLSAFKSRVIRVPRWQRPIVIAVMSVLLFGSLCMVSFFQQALVSAEHATVVRQGEWMIKHTAMAKEESDLIVDVEPGYRLAAPNHHSLKVQQKLNKRAELAHANGQAAFHKVAPFKMTKGEELAALMSFITGTAANTLPAIDPEDASSLEGFLPFNPHLANAKAEIDELVRTQWEDHPVMVLGNMRDIGMRDARALLTQYNIKPAPFYVDIDQRVDSHTLSASLERILGKQDGPYILLRGQNIGNAVKLAELEKKETLVETVAASGASIAKKLKRNKHQKEEERKENERVLGPRPIVIA
ncbi:hypothetical protein IAT38_007626 [Cryptococcus sp. DSM 104549]